MSKYEVSIIRGAWREHTFVVEAENDYKACELAKEEAYDFDWNDEPEEQSEYEISSSDEIPEDECE